MLGFFYSYEGEYKTFPNVYIFVESLPDIAILVLKIIVLVIVSMFCIPVLILTGSNIRRYLEHKPRTLNSNLQLEKLKIKLLGDKNLGIIIYINLILEFEDGENLIKYKE